MPGGTIWYTVTTEFDGKPITGSYSVSKQTVTVRLGADSKTAQARASAEATAKMTLRALARAAELRESKEK